MFTALVFSPQSRIRLKLRAAKLNLVPEGWEPVCHHVTLALKDDWTLPIGTVRDLKVIAFGKIEGKVTAFKVEGADDIMRLKTTPHITIATAPDVKPREAKGITEWEHCEPFTVCGAVEICGN